MSNIFVPPLGGRSTVRIWAVMAASGFCAIFVMFVGLWASANIDKQAIITQQNFANRGLADILTTLQRQQLSMTTWNEAVTAVKTNDQKFITNNLGVWAGEFFGIDEAYVLGPDNRPTYAMRNNRDVALAVYEEVRPLSAPLVVLLRQRMAAASAGKGDSTEAVGNLGEVDTITIRGVAAVISVKPIVPSSSAMSQAPGSEYLHVVVEYIDDPLIGAIADQYALHGAQLVAKPAATFWMQGVPLPSANGKAQWYLVWESNRPALSFIIKTAPVLMGGALLGALLLTFLGRQLTRATKELQVSEAHALYLAFHDVLTGLPNRAMLEDRLEYGLAQMRRDGKRFALLLLDLDMFKNINDTLGHPAGDEVIRQVAARLRSVVREADTVARLGGDEFAIIQMAVDEQSDVECLSQRIIETMQMPFQLSGKPTYVGISVGITMSFAAATDRAEMLRKADIALYDAKSQGGGGYSIFAGNMDETVQQRHQLEADLRVAIDSKTQIMLVYQPLFAADGVTIVGAEALARWHHPLLGTLSPGLFIGVAEERGLIDKLGEWLLRDACGFAARTSIPWIAVNVSPVQFRNENFADLVKSILQEFHLSPSKLQLEITEGVLLTNPEVTEATLNKLRAYGVRVALDDFGTGYSSISYLHRYGVDKLKIDRSFVQQLGESEDSDALVRAMVQLGRAMRLEVTAEGVETAEQRRHLAEMGCHELQGFLMSRPISADQLQSLLQLPQGAHRLVA
jgi:diguanylate cyclase (GGDEF)-like protein